MPDTNHKTYTTSKPTSAFDGDLYREIQSMLSHTEIPPNPFENGECRPDIYSDDNAVELDDDEIIDHLPITEQFFVENGAPKFTAEYDYGDGAIVAATHPNENASKYHAAYPTIPSECRYMPDALYHANNIGDVPPGRATCVWAHV